MIMGLFGVVKGVFAGREIPAYAGMTGGGGHDEEGVWE